MVIKQYKVEKGIATPVNPYEHKYQDAFPYYKDFAEQAKAHTYATNAQDGVYDADFFGEAVWQHNRGGDIWVNQTDEEMKLSPIGKKYKAFFRQFLPFNPIPKMETTELPSPEKTEYRVGIRANDG